MLYFYFDVKLKGSILNGCIYEFFLMIVKNSILQREFEFFGYIVVWLDNKFIYMIFFISNSQWLVVVRQSLVKVVFQSCFSGVDGNLYIFFRVIILMVFFLS